MKHLLLTVIFLLFSTSLLSQENQFSEYYPVFADSTDEPKDKVYVDADSLRADIEKTVYTISNCLASTKSVSFMIMSWQKVVLINFLKRLADIKVDDRVYDGYLINKESRRDLVALTDFYKGKVLDYNRIFLYWLIGNELDYRMLYLFYTRNPLEDKHSKRELDLYYLYPNSRYGNFVMIEEKSFDLWGCTFGILANQIPGRIKDTPGHKHSGKSDQPAVPLPEIYRDAAALRDSIDKVLNYVSATLEDSSLESPVSFDFQQSVLINFLQHIAGLGNSTFIKTTDSGRVIARAELERLLRYYRNYDYKARNDTVHYIYCDHYDYKHFYIFYNLYILQNYDYCIRFTDSMTEKSHVKMTSDSSLDCSSECQSGRFEKMVGLINELNDILKGILNKNEPINN